MARRIFVNRKWLVLTCILFWVNACATPTQQNIKYAIANGLQPFDIQGTNFTHTVFLNQKSSEGIWHIYIEGDGKPWIDNQFIARDPTTIKPLMLRLMIQDNAPAIYLGRPCYFGKNNSGACHPLFWTHRRYSEQVVTSMAAVLKKIIKSRRIQSLTLIGHSGGGALAMLLAEKIPETTIIVTLAGNLDIDAWTDHHGHSKLDGSLNPAFRKPLPSSIRQYHYLGKRDRNITASMIISVVDKQHNVELFLLDHYGHDCCWERDWQTFLNNW